MSKDKRALRRHVLIRCSYSADARIVNISINGCKVESRTTPNVGEQVEFTAELRGVPTVLRGIVVYTLDGSEFGLRFAGLDEDVRSRVRAVATS